MTLPIFLTVLLFFYSGPAQSDMEPPHLDEITSESSSKDLKRSLRKCEDDGCKLWHKYALAARKGRDHNKKACTAWASLLDAKTFPLFPLVLVHASETCVSDPKLTKKISKLLKGARQKENPRWFMESLTMAASKSVIVSDDPDGPDLLWKWLGDVSSKKNKISYLQDGLEFAQSKNSPRVADFKKELYRLAPRFNPEPEDFASSGFDAYNNHDYKTAYEDLRKAKLDGELPLNVKRQVLDQLKNTLKALQRRKQALKESKELWLLDLKNIKSSPAAESQKHLLSSGLSYSRFLWTEHQNKKAQSILSTLEKTLPDSVSLSELYFVRGRINEEEKKFKDAIKNYEKALNDLGRDVDPVLRTNISWARAWLYYKMDQFQKALESLQPMIDVETDPGREAQELFWIAKSKKALGERENAKQMFEDLARDDPYGYYGLLSLRELKRALPATQSLANADTFGKSPKRLPWASLRSANDFRWLVSLGEWESARLILDDEVPLPDGVPADFQNIFSLYAQAAYFNPIFSRLSKLSPAEKRQLFSSHGPLIFPILFSDLIVKEAHARKLEPEFVFSIVRQESGFDPLAQSPAGAEGLMQILPSVARPLTKKKDFDLLDPETNVSIGTRHLKNYLKVFKDQFILTSAAYNASVPAVQSWLKMRGSKDPLIFIEDIPYEETRTYVKLVFRNYVNYKRLSHVDENTEFPERCLQGVQASKR